MRRACGHRTWRELNALGCFRGDMVEERGYGNHTRCSLVAVKEVPLAGNVP